MTKLQTIASTAAMLQLASESLRCTGRHAEADAYAVRFANAVYHLTSSNGNSIDAHQAANDLRLLRSSLQRLSTTIAAA